MRDCSWVESQFENAFSEGFDCSSDRTDHLPGGGYNCIAWAAGKKDNWWWPIDDPGAFWPIPLNPEDPVSLREFIKAFESLGYTRCGTPDIEEGIEKVAIYVDDTGIPTHAARLLATGVWTSKLGKLEDVEHATLHAFEGFHYGVAAAFLKRKFSDDGTVYPKVDLGQHDVALAR